MALYRLLLPVYLLAVLPAWLWKMARRDGFGTGLLQRAARYDGEPGRPGAVHVHAVSVGECLLALRLIRAWRERDPQARFVLAVGTATGLAVAKQSVPEGVRALYQPVDLRRWVRRYLDRFEPAQLVLVEGEMWPNLMGECARRSIPVRLVNARMSPRSRRRYRRFAALVRPVFRHLDVVAVQDETDVDLWETLGARRVEVTGSLKFDPGGGAEPALRPEFAAMLDICSAGRPVVLAASTHAGEERLLANAAREAGAFPLVVPRHAERRAEVRADLAREGFEVVLRSDFHPPKAPETCCLVIDTTGELRDWTAHADVVVIGKSFLGTGGQNPAEAVLAGKPLIFGAHMENFEPLAGRLVEAGGAVRVPEPAELESAIRFALQSEVPSTDAARETLAPHEGATGRMLELLGAGTGGRD